MQLHRARQQAQLGSYGGQLKLIVPQAPYNVWDTWYLLQNSQTTHDGRNGSFHSRVQPCKACIASLSEHHFTARKHFTFLNFPVCLLYLVLLMMLDEGHKGLGDPNNGQSNNASPSNFSKSGSVSVKKQPPPESLESLRVRSLVIGSFWAIVIFLGLPIWWWTTSIYRARLPLQEMLEWADGKVGVLKSITFCVYEH